MGMNIVGDIAGQFKTLEALLDKMPEGTPVSVGDQIDRGPESHKVIDFFMNNGMAILGNHEHLFIDWYEQTGIYDRGVYFMNGGGKTVECYIKEAKGDLKDLYDFVKSQSYINKDHINYLKSLPLYIEHEDAFGKILITHAPVNPVFGLQKCVDNVSARLGGEHSVIWNRGNPREMECVDLQIFGHNASSGVKWFSSGSRQNHSVCIDTSHAEILTGIHWPTQEIFQQEFIT